MRTLETIRMYNFAQKNHWQLMCDLSTNDYDIHYFDGRQSANIALDEFLQAQQVDGFDINKILEFIANNFEEYSQKQVNFYKENNCFNEYYRGYVTEIELLAKIVKQDY